MAVLLASLGRHQSSLVLFNYLKTKPRITYIHTHTEDCCLLSSATFVPKQLLTAFVVAALVISPSCRAYRVICSGHQLLQHQ